MKIDLKSEEGIEFLNGFTVIDVNGNENAQLMLVNSNLIIVVGEKLAARITGQTLGHELYSSKTIIFGTRDGKLREIILEVHCSEEDSLKLSRMISKRNLLVNLKDPLQLDYSKANRESILSTKSKPANLRGFFNLFIIFSFMNYWRLVIEHSMKFGPVFLANVDLSDFRLHRELIRSLRFSLRHIVLHLHCGYV
jgi:hypothetical protein